MTRGDYRRGREAIGVLAGKRRPGAIEWQKRSWSRALVVPVTGALVVAVTVALAVFGSPSTAPDTGANGRNPTPAAPGHVVTRPSPTQRILPLESVRFDTWEDAKRSARWPLREPASLPRGFRLTALQAFVLDPSAPIDEIVASYTGPRGATISFSQAFVAVPAAFSFERAIPSPPADIGLERIEIDGSLGYWMAGVPIVDANGSPAGWDADAIVIEWQTGDVVYRLRGHAIELAALTAIARSIAPISE
jgi:hypothetical protein